MPKNLAKRIAGGAVLCAVLCLGAGGARADWLSDLVGNDPGRLAVGGGVSDFMDTTKYWQGRAEYDFAHGYYFVHPMIGIYATNKKSGFAYAGFNFDLHITQHLVLVPNAAIGYYHQGDGKDLGQSFNFKTGMRLDYRFPDASRIGVAFDHVSNAGMSSKNDGENNVVIMFSIPIGSL